MATSKQAVTSLLTEHFRYTPLTLLDDIINTVNELIYRAVTAVESGLTSTPASSLGFDARAVAENGTPEKDEDGNPIYPEARTEIENGVHQLETLLQATVDKNFDKLEIYVLRNILSVPEELAPWIRLRHYEGLDFSRVQQTRMEEQQEERRRRQGPEDAPDVQPPTPTPESLHLLRRKLTETRKLQHLLLAERSRNAAFLTQLQDLLQSSASQTQSQTTDPSQAPRTFLAFLASTPQATNLGLSFNSASAKQPLTEHTRFAVSQLPALRQLLSALKQKEAEGLRFARHTGAADERREYIETQVRRRLETEGVGSAGGEGAEGKVEGRTSAGAEEARSLEGVARMLGAASGGGGGEKMEE